MRCNGKMGMKKSDATEMRAEILSLLALHIKTSSRTNIHRVSTATPEMEQIGTVESNAHSID